MKRGINFEVNLSDNLSNLAFFALKMNDFGIWVATFTTTFSLRKRKIGSKSIVLKLDYTVNTVKEDNNTHQFDYWSLIKQSPK